MWKSSSYEREVQFFETFWEKKGSFLWVTLETRKVQFLESYFLKKRFNSLSHVRKKSSTLWVKFEKCSTLWVILKKKVQLFESCKKQLIWKRGSLLWDILENKKGSILCVVKNSIFWVIEKSVLCEILKKTFNYLSHFLFKKNRVIFEN